MSLLELTLPGADAAWLNGLALLAALGALFASWRVARRTARDRRRIDGMHRDLQVFAEASTRVADTLDHLLRGDVDADPGPVGRERGASSRRYLLLQARERLERGEPIESLAASLELCEDERRLLEFFDQSGRLARRVRVA